MGYQPVYAGVPSPALHDGWLVLTRDIPALGLLDAPRLRYMDPRSGQLAVVPVAGTTEGFGGSEAILRPVAPVSASIARTGPPPAREVVLLVEGGDRRVVIANPRESRVRHVLGPSFPGLDAVAVAGQHVVWEHGQVEDALGARYTGRYVYDVPSGRREARVLAGEPNQEDGSVRAVGERLVVRHGARDRVLLPGG